MGGQDPGGKEAINRLNLGLTVRGFRAHALKTQYIASSRGAVDPDWAGTRQMVETVGLVCSLIGDTGFGAVK